MVSFLMFTLLISHDIEITRKSCGCGVVKPSKLVTRFDSFTRPRCSSVGRATVSKWQVVSSVSRPMILEFIIYKFGIVFVAGPIKPYQ